jgi:rSAM/selenodomain-associated transferase 1
MHEPVEIAILAKAPVPGFAKTRLISLLGAERAALLQAQLIERAANTAAAAKLGAVTLWGAPDQGDPLFHKVCARHCFALRRQAEGDLGARMLAAAQAAKGTVLVIGTDCPGLTPMLLRSAADILRGGSDAVILPAEDGGYVLIGMRRAQPALFDSMPWGTGCVLGETRQRLMQLGLTWQEPALLWDLDVPGDLDRLHGTGLFA